MAAIRGGKKRPYKVPSRKKARKQYQEYLRREYPMKAKGGASTHEVSK